MAASPSKINEPEAFDVGQTSFLASREPVTALTARGSDGAAFVGTRNSVSLIILTGNPQVPVLPRGVFENTGVAHAGAMTWFYDTLYVFSSTGSLCRSQGSEEPDLSFGLPVQNEFMRRGFTAENTFVAGDERNGAIIVASGNRAYPYMLASGRWSGVIILPGVVTGKVELNGAAHLQIGAGLYQLDAANGGGNWFLRSPYLGGRPGFRHHLKTLREFWGASKNAVTMNLLVDESGASIGGKFPYAFTPPRGRVQKSRRRFRSIALKVSGTIGNQQFHSAQIDYTVNPARK